MNIPPSTGTGPLAGSGYWAPGLTPTYTLYPVTGDVPAFGGADHETVAAPTPETADWASGAADTDGVGGGVDPVAPDGAGVVTVAVVVLVVEVIGGTDWPEVPNGAVPTAPRPSPVVVVVEDDWSAGRSVGGGLVACPASPGPAFRVVVVEAGGAVVVADRLVGWEDTASTRPATRTTATATVAATAMPDRPSGSGDSPSSHDHHCFHPCAQFLTQAPFDRHDSRACSRSPGSDRQHQRHAAVAFRTETRGDGVARVAPRGIIDRKAPGLSVNAKLTPRCCVGTALTRGPTGLIRGGRRAGSPRRR